MKSFMLIFLIWEPILAHSTPVSQNIENRSELELRKTYLTQIPILKEDDTKVKEPKFKVPKLEVLKVETSKHLKKDKFELKDDSKLKDEIKVKTELKLKDELELKDNLTLEEASDSKSADRPKKACKTLTGPNTTPTKICFEVTPGVQGPLEVCNEDRPEFVNHPQISQEPQLSPSIPQEPQLIPQPTHINYEIPQPNYQFTQPNYELPQLPFFYNELPPPSAQIPITWCIQTETGQQNFPSIFQIHQQIPQGSIYQAQPQQIGYTQNLPSNYPQNPFSFPTKICPSYHTLPFVPPQTSTSTYSQNLPSGYPPLIFPNHPQNLPSVLPQQQFGFSQSVPSCFSQNFISDYPQSLSIYSQNLPNQFSPFSFGPTFNRKFETVQPNSQGFISTGGNQSGKQGGAQSSAPGSSDHFVQPSGAVPTGEGNSQNIHQQATQNAIHFDARRLQPGPLSRILDRPSSFQMSGRAGTMENSWGPLMNQGPRFSREPETDTIQHENAHESDQKSQPQPLGKGEQSTLKI